MFASRLTPLLRQLSGRSSTVARAAAGQSRGFSAEAEPVNCWEAPTNPAKWKREHVVFAVLGGWAVVIYAGRALLSSPKKAPADKQTK